MITKNDTNCRFKMNNKDLCHIIFFVKSGVDFKSRLTSEINVNDLSPIFCGIMLQRLVLNDTETILSLMMGYKNSDSTWLWIFGGHIILNVQMTDIRTKSLFIHIILFEIIKYQNLLRLLLLINRSSFSLLSFTLIN